MAATIASNIVTDGLVACWDASNRKSYPGAGTVWSDPVSGNDGVLTNGPTFSEDNLGTISFDGSNDHVLVADSSELRIGLGHFAISMWILDENDDSSYFVWMAKGQTGADEWSLYHSTTNRLRFYADSGGIDISYTGAMNDGAWHHVVVTRDAVTTTLYKDGVSVGSDSVDGYDLNTTKDISIGASEEGSARFTTGKIADARLYNNALTAAEVLQNYNATKRRFVGTESDSLVSYWDAGDIRSYPKTYSSVHGSRWENIGKTGLDSLTNGDVFLLNGGVYGGTLAADGRSISFDATDDIGTLNKTPRHNFADKKFSFICWVKPASGNDQYNGVFGRVGAGWTTGYALYHESATQLLFFAGSYTTHKALKNVTENEWNHVAGTVSTTEVLLYVNGSVSTSVVAPGTVDQSTYALFVGGVDASVAYTMEGDLANLALYNRTLTAAEVVQHYNQTKGNFT